MRPYLFNDLAKATALRVASGNPYREEGSMRFASASGGATHNNGKNRKDRLRNQPLYGDNIPARTRTFVDERGRDAWRRGGAAALVEEMASRVDQPRAQHAVTTLTNTPHPVHGKTMADMLEIEKSVNYATPITPEQQDEINALVLEKIETGAASRTYGKRAVIVLGLPGAGKSSVISAFQRDLNGLEIDADHFKQRLTGFNGGLGAFAVHERSSTAAGDTIAIAMDRGENLILPKIGSTANEKSITKLITALRQKGYTAEVHVVQLDNTEAQRRVVERFLGTATTPGTQTVPVNYVQSLRGKEPVRLLEKLIRTGVVDTWSIMHNNVGRGEPYGIIADARSQRTVDAIFEGRTAGRAVRAARRPRQRPAAARAR